MCPIYRNAAFVYVYVWACCEYMHLRALFHKSNLLVQAYVCDVDPCLRVYVHMQLWGIYVRTHIHVCMCIYMCVCTCMQMCLPFMCMYLCSVRSWACASSCVNLYVAACQCICAYLCTAMCLYVWACTYSHECVCTSTCVCMFLFQHSHARNYSYKWSLTAHTPSRGECTGQWHQRMHENVLDDKPTVNFLFLNYRSWRWRHFIFALAIRIAVIIRFRFRLGFGFLHFHALGARLVRAVFFGNHVRLGFCELNALVADTTTEHQHTSRHSRHKNDSKHIGRSYTNTYTQHARTSYINKNSMSTQARALGLLLKICNTYRHAPIRGGQRRESLASYARQWWHVSWPSRTPTPPKRNFLSLKSLIHKGVVWHMYTCIPT